MLLPLACAVALAAGGDDEAVVDLAPGPEELARVQEELERRLVIAEATGSAVARLQGDVSGNAPSGSWCADAAQAERLGRLRVFADAWRDAVQRARIQADRLARTASAPTVELVVDEARREAVGALLARSDREVDAWLELVAWFQKTAPRACATEAPLRPFPGLPQPGVLARGEVPAPPVALLVSGYACIGGVTPIQGDGRLVLLEAPACWSADAGCGCTPVDVLPGAVLGPPAPAPAPAP